MVLATTFVLVYNADLMLRLLERLGGGTRRLLPAVRTAVAYPLVSKLRTGMAMAMISLVVFVLVVMSTMNTNFDRVFLNDEARGGWDVAVQENPGNPLVNLQGLMGVLVSKDPGDEITIEISRGTTVMTLRATLSVRSPRKQSE